MKLIKTILLVIISFILLAIISLSVFYWFLPTSIFHELGGRYYLTYTGYSNDVGIVDGNRVYVISGHILDYAFDARFILIAERPRKSVPECVTGPYKKCEEAFEKSQFVQYWIIDKDKPEYAHPEIKTEYRRPRENVYGPYPEEDYLKKRQELHIPAALQLK